MNGWPVWLASASAWDTLGHLVPSSRWTDTRMAQVSASLDILLDGVGDPTREREFRMCVTLCRHRALTQAEHDALPDWWHAAPAVDVAGGPVEIMWHKGIPETVSTLPCENPTREVVAPRRLDIWLPIDCGRCPPCVARAACATIPPERYARTIPEVV